MVEAVSQAAATAKASKHATVVNNIYVSPEHPCMPDGTPAPYAMNLNTLSKFLGTKRSTAHNYHKTRVLKGFHLGKELYFTLDEVMRFLKWKEEQESA